jgi:hypothetical protein
MNKLKLRKKAMAPDTVPLSAASVIDALVWNTSQSSSAAETSEAVVGCTEAIDSGAQTV